MSINGPRTVLTAPMLAMSRYKYTGELYDIDHPIEQDTKGKHNDNQTPHWKSTRQNAGKLPINPQIRRCRGCGPLWRWISQCIHRSQSVHHNLRPTTELIAPSSRANDWLPLLRRQRVQSANRIWRHHQGVLEHWHDMRPIGKSRLPRSMGGHVSANMYN